MADKYMPEWAKRLENWGKEMERKYGSGAGKSCGEEKENGDVEDSSQQASNDNAHFTHRDHRWPKDGRPYWQRQNNPIGEIVGNIISYFIVTYAPVYFPGFFLEGYPAVRTVIILSIIVHVIASIFMLIIPVRPIFYLGRTIMSIAGIVSMVVIVTIFPFNIPYGLGHLAQFALWIAIVIVSIVAFFDFLKIFGSDYC